MRAARPTAGPRDQARRARRSLGVALCLLLLSLATARDNLFASAYGPLAHDLLDAFHARETQCHAAIEVPDVCFEVRAAGAGPLAETLADVVEDYRSAGLRMGEWRAANGVWAVELRFGAGAHGSVEVYLTESGRGDVRGMLVLSPP